MPRRAFRFILFCLSLLTVMPPAASAAPAPRLDACGDPLPAGALARLGTVRLRHAGPVLCVAFSPDGKTLASGGTDHAARVWDVETGRLIREFTDLPGNVNDVLFSPDGRSVVMASNPEHARGVVTRRGVADGKEIHAYRDLWSPACLALSPDGKTLVGGGKDGKLCVWDWDTGELNGTHGIDAIFGMKAIAFSPDGGVLGMVNGQGTLTLWDWNAEKPLYSVNPVFCSLAFAPDGKTFVARENSAVVRRNVQCGYPDFPLANRKCCQTGSRTVAFAPDGAAIAAAVDGAVYLWDADTGKELRRLDADPVAVTALAFAPDGKRLATAGFDGAIRVWELPSGKVTHAFDAEPAGSVTARFVGGERLAVLHQQIGSDPSIVDSMKRKSATIVYSWNPFRTGSAAVSEMRTFASYWVLISSDGARVVVTNFENDGGTMELYDPLLGKMLHQIGERGDYRLVLPQAISEDGNMLAASCFKGAVTDGEPLRLWDVRSGQSLREITHPYDSVSRAGFSPDGKVLAVVGGRPGRRDSFVSLFDTATGEELPCTVSCRPEGYYFTFSPDGRQWVVGHTEYWSESGELATFSIRELSTGGERLRISTTIQNCCAVSPDGRWLASGGDNGDVHLWDMLTGRERRTFTGHHGGVHSLSFAPDGKSLASGSADGTALLWDVSESAPPRPDEKPLTPRQLDACWSDLADQDAGRAFQAVTALTQSGDAAAAFLRERLRPVRIADPKQLARLIAALDGDDFTVREEASRRLAELEEAARPALEDARQHGLSAEAQRRATELLDRLAQWPPAPERLRAVRAVEVLERLGTLDARHLLRELADGVPGAQQTREARAALDRLTRSSASAP